MAKAQTAETRALNAKAAAEAKGYAVKALEVDGRRFRLEFVTEPGGDDLDLLDWNK